MLELTDRFADDSDMCTMMITHNMKAALEHGNRTILMKGGRIAMDIKGKERDEMTVERLIEQFEIDNDRDAALGGILFSGEKRYHFASINGILCGRDILRKDDREVAVLRNLNITFWVLVLFLLYSSFRSGQFNDPVSWLMSTLMTIPGIVIGLAFHEYAHALAAYKLGDPTPKKYREE